MNSNSVVLFDNIVAASLMDQPYPQSEKTAEAMVQKLMASYACFHHRDVSLIFGSKGFAVPLGGKMRKSDDAPASLISHPLKALADFSHLDFQAGSFEKNARAQQLYQAAEELDQKLNGDCLIRFCMGSTFTLAAQLYSPEKMMKAMIKSKDELHDFLQSLLDLQFEMIDQFSHIPSLIFHLSDPLASPALISPSFYREFADPYCRQLVQAIHSHQKEVTLHICGNTTKILDDMVETEVDILSLDQAVDLGEASQIIGKRAAILGNVDPVGVLQEGQISDVQEAVKTAYEKAGDHPGGFILGPGCDLPYHTPVENLQAFVQAGQQYS